MPTSSCRFIGKTGEHELSITCSFFGLERYCVDGKQVHSHFSLRFTGERRFVADGRALTVRYTLQSLLTRADVFIEGEPIAQDLFAEFNQSMTGDVVLGKTARYSTWLLFGGLTALALVLNA